jgi:mono/diheme cytochrome c family protein
MMRNVMKRVCAVLAMTLLAALAGLPALAQRGAKASADAFPDGPGKDLLLAKCFQCHGPTMWMMQRQDRRAWESTLYRMVGRGALWTEDEIRAMADYLGANYGRKAP